MAKQDQTKPAATDAKTEPIKEKIAPGLLGQLPVKKADDDFAIWEQPAKTSDRPGTARFKNAPSNYIVVNDSSLVAERSERSIIILIDWKTFIEDIVAKNYDNELSKAYSIAVDDVLMRLTKGQNRGIDISDKEHLLNVYFNKALLECKTTLTSNIAGNSCSFSIENFDDKWIVQKKGPFWGQSLIQEGMRFIVDGRGRFKTDNFYRMFTGYITGISEKANPTDKSLSFACADGSRYLKYTRYNTNPALFSGDPLATTGKEVVVSNTNLVQLNGAEIIKKVVLGGDKGTPADKHELKEPYLWQIENDSNVPDAKLKEGNSKIGLPITKEGLLEPDYKRNWHIINKANRYKSYTYKNVNKDIYPKALMWGHTGEVYTFMFGTLSLRFDEFQTKADILTNIANLTHYLAYIDGAGNLHYHPPKFEDYYRVMVDGVDGEDDEHDLTYTIFDDDTISQSYSQNEGEVCTVARGMGEGNFGINAQLREKQIDPNYMKANMAWMDGINRFGFRERKVSTAAFNNQNLLTLFTAGFIIRANQERYQMSAQFIMRPELQPDRPIYDFNKNKWYHIRQVTHTYMVGGPNSGGAYSTDIICYAGRNPGETVAANLFAAAPKEVTKSVAAMKTFLKNYSSAYNIEDLGSLQIDTNKKKETVAGKTQGGTPK